MIDPENVARSLGEAPAAAAKDPLLVSIGQRVKTLRARRGMPRRSLAEAADVSERHLANLETGVGNVSVLILRQIADALDCPMTDLFGDEAATGPEWLLIRQLLQNKSEPDLQRAREHLAQMFTAGAPVEQRLRKIAFIGLRGAGKSTLGKAVAKALGRSFVELGSEITRLAGCSPNEIQDLYGPAAYRRYEAQALQETVLDPQSCVLATPGGLVSDAGTFNLLLGNAFTVWLRASPEEHMNRVIAQGDLRPMKGNEAAMDDLKAILSGREAFYAKADLTYDTTGRTLEDSLAGVMTALRPVLTHAG